MAGKRTSRQKARLDLTKFDWSKVDSTNDEDIARQIAADPDTAREMTSADQRKARLVRPPDSVDVRTIRTRLGLSQSDFARRYGFATRTVQDWEQRRRVPAGPARLLLRMIEKEPEAVERVLSGI